MDRLSELIAVLCLFKCVKAQDTSNQPSINPLHPSMSVVIVVLAIMFSITFLIVAYAKYCHNIEPRLAELQQPEGTTRSRSRFSGIDRTIVESLPFFRFSSLKGSKVGLECVVCLSRFEETEILRLLPKCRHAFHINCIDKWLENHSSCPLCRHRFDVGDLKSFTYTNSFRNFPEEQNLGFFIQRERSSRFNVANTFQKFLKREEPLIQDFRNEKVLHNFKHKIIVSDVMHKSRWSDVNSSDLMSLNSEMLNVVSSRRLANEVSVEEQIFKIKEDMDRKRLYESKIVTKTESSPGESSGCCNDSNVELGENVVTKSFDPAEKRSMSEITNVSRFTEMNTSSRFSSSVNMGRDDRVRRLWIPIARRTIQWFSSRETSSDARNIDV